MPFIALFREEPLIWKGMNKMAVCKCKMCGGDLHITETDRVTECEYCGTTQTVPSADNEKKMTLFNRANRLRLNSEFDKAAALYEQIVSEFPEEPEAYWGLCLCNYGVEYVDDPATGEKKPTCHRASFEKLSSDENFALAMEYADMIAQRQYRAEAREIDRINENQDRLASQLEQGIGVDIPIDGENGLYRRIKRYEDLLKKK